MKFSSPQALGILATLCIVSSCTDADFSESQASVAAQLRDPDSAEFRNERVRVLWSTDGTRLKIYCAEVNANNAFGGKTGFKPVSRVLSYTKNGQPIDGSSAQVGQAFVETGPTANFELRCNRRDTQREDGTVATLVGAFGGSSPEAIEKEMKAIPVMSNELAPELR
jgi:hypothetical protein